uniref:ATP synthase subunit a n=1 Tax=Dicyrtomina saundersi TaxID=438492 RepID=A0A516EZT3_9HEXA|nr:ATP synthase F0 subunit 6 [Dicyrtomina saundersi]QDO72013.1 ATP synthase F0 subunit 6 [Dicyrtomina saundersi]
MMSNLFSIFDPTSSFKILNNWVALFIVILVMTPKYWKSSFKFNTLIKKMLFTLHEEFKTIIGPTSSKGITSLLIMLFTFILVNNFLGLFPYIFNSTSHMTITLSLALPLWLALMLYGWMNYSMHMFAHLVPQSTPTALMPFMVLIETISNTIRPMTLAVRLMANMIAGHLLMTLLGNQAVGAPMLIMSMVVLAQMMLLALELSVSIIQSYVFSVLVTLYTSEISDH